MNPELHKLYDPILIIYIKKMKKKLIQKMNYIPIYEHRHIFNFLLKRKSTVNRMKKKNI